MVHFFSPLLKRFDCFSILPIIISFFKCKFVKFQQNQLNAPKFGLRNHNDIPIIFNPNLHTHEDLLLQHALKDNSTTANQQVSQ